MIALQISSVKNFMNQLLKTELFDPFWLVEASVTTYNTFTIDGRLHKNFYDLQTQEALKDSRRTYSLWQEVKPFCLSVIRGKNTPLSFKIIFQLSRENTERMLQKSGLSLAPEDISGLFLNILFSESGLTVTTGTSYHIFTMDKTFDTFWDKAVLSFFIQHDISYEQIS